MTEFGIRRSELGVTDGCLLGMVWLRRSAKLETRSNIGADEEADVRHCQSLSIPCEQERPQHR